MALSKRIITACSTVAVLAAFITTTFTVDARYAKSEELQKVEERLDRKILEDRIATLQKKIWDLEDRWTARYVKQHGEYPETTKELVAFMTKEDRERHRELTKERDELKEQLNPPKKSD